MSAESESFTGADAVHPMFAGSGEMAALMRSTDWAATPLGPPARWQQSLKTAVGICLTSRFPVLICWGPELIALYNDEYRQILGERHPRALGRSASEWWGDTWLPLGPIVERVMTLGEAGSSECPVPMPARGASTDQRFFSFTCSPIHDESDRVGGVFCALLDVTDRRRTEDQLHERDAALRRSEERYRAIVESQSEMVCRFRPDGELLFVNGAYARARGTTPDALQGTRFWDFIAEADRPGVRAMLGRLTPATPEVRIENRFDTTEGTRWTLWTNTALSFDASGRPFEVQSSGIDITDRRRREQHAVFLGEITQDLSRLSATGEIMALVAERLGKHLGVSGCAFIEVPADAREMSVVHDWNAPGHRSVAGPHRLSDYFSSEALSLLAAGRQLIVNDTATDARIAAGGAALGRLSIRSLVHTPYLSDGRWKASLTVRDTGPRAWTSDEVELLRELASRLWANIERVEAEQRLRASEAELRRASQIKDEFLATLSHELRTPLNAVVGWAHMLRTGIVRGEAAERALESLERNANAQMLLVNDLLDMSRIVSGRLQIESRIVDLRDVLAGAVETVRPAALSKHVALKHAIAAELPLQVHGDPDRLRQIVWNLLSNALKFTPTGGEVVLSVARDGADAEISVRDTGEGIDLEFLPFVFDRFRQADATTTRRHGGLGLGLAIVRHLVEAHGGTVSAASEGLHRGSAFTVRLPLAAIQTSAAERATASEVHRLLEGVRLLVVDDEPDARELLEVALGSQGARVVAVPSAAAALAALTGAERFDALLADIAMPDQDGLALIRTIRAGGGDAARIPAIAVTAYTTARERERALDAGFDSHLSKPLEPTALLRVVAAAVQQRRRQEPAG